MLWEGDDGRFDTNPRFEVTEESQRMIALWQRCRSDMGGLAHLPDEGGPNQQAAVNLEAFDVIEHWLGVFKAEVR